MSFSFFFAVALAPPIKKSFCFSSTALPSWAGPEQAMAEMDDYESLPEDTPVRVTAMAGALAGIAEHVALYPVDSVKVRPNTLIK